MGEFSVSTHVHHNVTQQDKKNITFSVFYFSYGNESFTVEKMYKLNSVCTRNMKHKHGLLKDCCFDWKQNKTTKNTNTNPQHMKWDAFVEKKTMFMIRKCDQT